MINTMPIDKDKPPCVGPPGLTGKVIRFAEFLKEQGFSIFQSRVHDALRSLEEIDFSQREDFFTALRMNMTSCDIEWARFPLFFEEFWGGTYDGGREEQDPVRERQEDASPSDTCLQTDNDVNKSAETAENDHREWLEGVAYSPVSRVEKKDLARFDKADIQVARLVLKRMIEPFNLQPSRRSRRSRQGHIDFPRIMRRSFKGGGMPMELFYREKKKRLKRLVILADVSGSMDRYACFVMPFLLGLRGVGARASVYVFSTSLAPVTFIVRHLSIEKALERIAREVPDWSGGTRIGYSLHQFNQNQRFLDRRTVVVILSDGWDLGGKELLKREMATLSRKAHCVMWLNPLAGDPKYEPMCRGMKVALPYVDYFLPADSLNSLRRVGRLLSRIMVH